MSGLTHGLFGWSLAGAMAMVAAALALWTGRRRTAINEALHELRRPLQAIALSGTSPGEARGVVESSTRLASAALERLDCAVNGGSEARIREVVWCEEVMRSAVARWKARVALGGGTLELRWRAGIVAISADRAALGQAIDNLIVNAIEHGGPEIVVEGRRRAGSLCVSVRDSGRDSRPAARRNSPAEVIARITGRRRHGHGLAVVRRVAAAHHGRFVLQRAGDGTVATLELPIPADPAVA
jgi:signal transduction histidine kinase